MSLTSAALSSGFGGMQGMQSALLAGTSDDGLRKIIYDRVISKSQNHRITE